MSFYDDAKTIVLRAARKRLTRVPSTDILLKKEVVYFICRIPDNAPVDYMGVRRADRGDVGDRRLGNFRTEKLQSDYKP